MSRRAPIPFLILAVVVAAVCIRLGFWQLSRLGERRAANALVASRLDSAAVGPERLPADTMRSRFRRVELQGEYDFAHELVLAGRTHDGSPGINFLTPLRLPGRDTAIIVNRGWVYAPDAMTVELPRWREAGPVRVGGFVNTYHDASADAAIEDRPRTLKRFDYDAIAAALPYPVADYYVVATSPAVGSRDSVPVRLEAPPLDEGPHLSYAIQWFAFAVIGLAGAGVVWWSRRRGDEGRTMAPPAPPLPGR